MPATQNETLLITSSAFFTIESDELVTIYKNSKPELALELCLAEADIADTCHTIDFQNIVTGSNSLLVFDKVPENLLPTSELLLMIKAKVKTET